MAYRRGALDTPGGPSILAGNSSDDSGSLGGLDIGSTMESFRKPEDDANNDILRAAASKRKLNLTTPARQPFEQLLNRNAGGRRRQEFTPLLKSVSRSNIKARLAPTPSFRVGNDSVPGGDSFGSDSAEMTMKTDLPTSSANNSTVIKPLRRADEDGNMISAEGAMTLREQEKIIDEVKKENFSLKLRVYFLSDRLDKLGPEYTDAAIKENIEIKVERATLKAELKRYKKSLMDSEKAIAELREEIKAGHGKERAGYDEKRRSEEGARVQMELEEKCRKTEKELRRAREENEELKARGEKLEDRLERLEDGDGEDVRKMHQQVEKLEDEKLDLEAELREKERELDAKEEEFDVIEEKSKAKDEKIAEWEEEADNLQEQLRLLQSQQSGQSDAVKAALSMKDETLRNAERKIRDLENTIQKERNEKTQMQEQLERRAKRLEEDSERLKEELQEAKEETANKSFSWRGKFNQTDHIREKLVKELEEARSVYDDLEGQYQDKCKEATDLEQKLKEMDAEFDVEVANTQKEKDQFADALKLEKAKSSRIPALENEIHNLKDALQREHDSVGKNTTATEAKLREVQNELFSIKSEKDLLRTRHDQLTSESQRLDHERRRLEKNVQEANAMLAREREAALANEQTLRRNADAQERTLNAEIDSLEKKLDTRKRDLDRLNENWASEKRQLELRVEHSESAANELKRSIDALQKKETTIAGKESKLSESLRLEKERHKREETRLQQQIQDLKDEIDMRKASYEVKVTEYNHLREEQRQTKREVQELADKARKLDDECELLETDNERQEEAFKEQLMVSQTEVETLRTKQLEAKRTIAKLENDFAAANADLNVYKGDLAADESTQKQLKVDLQEAQRRLEAAKKEKRQFQEELLVASGNLAVLKQCLEEAEIERDALATRAKNDGGRGIDTEKTELKKAKTRLEIELHQVKQALEEMEIERDALKIRSKNDGGRALNSEMIDLKKARSRLEIELGQAKDDIELLDKQAEDKQVEFDELQKVAEELNETGLALEKELKTSQDAHRRETEKLKRTQQKLENRVDELLRKGSKDSDLEAELSSLRNQISKLRQRETELLTQDKLTKKEHASLRRQVEALESDLENARNLAALGGSSTMSASRGWRKEELDTVRAQLLDTKEQLREHRTAAKSLERQLADKAQNLEDAVFEKNALENELKEVRSSSESLAKKNLEAVATASELRKKIHTLDREVYELKLARGGKDAANLADETRQQFEAEQEELQGTIEQLSKDLEDLQLQISARDGELRERKRAERKLEQALGTANSAKSEEAQKALAAMEELERLSKRHRRTVENLAGVQKAWDVERKEIVSRVRFTDSTAGGSISPSQGSDTHTKELRGMHKQLIYLKAKIQREQAFRADLCWSKKFFEKQLEAHVGCNEAALVMLGEMGVRREKKTEGKRWTLKTVALAVRACVRVQREAQKWGEMKGVREKILEARKANVGRRRL